MAKEEKKPEPRFYDRLHDVAIDDVLKEYYELHGKKGESKHKKEFVSDDKRLYAMLESHLMQHNLDPKSKEPENRSYSSFKDKRKWIEDLIATFAAHGIGKMYGSNAVKAYLEAGNENMLKEYVEQNMLSPQEGGYEGLVSMLMDSEDLLYDFRKGQLSKIMDNYIDGISSVTVNKDRYLRHLSKTEHYDKVTAYTDKLLKEHKLKIKKGAKIEAILRQSIPLAANPDMHSQLKKMKHHEAIPNEKKK